jgi:membrane fusion protein, multidrug efflux system
MVDLRRRISRLSALALGVSLVLAACQRSADTPAGGDHSPPVAEIRSGVNGTIDRVGFEEGARVRRGQILFRIDPAPFRAESERRFIARSHAVSELELANANRARALRSGAALSRAQIERLSNDVSAATHELAAATTALNASKRALELTEIRAPIDGVAARALKKQGDRVSSDNLLTTVTDIRAAANRATDADLPRTTARLAH